MKLLIIEDDAAIAEVLRMEFEDAHYTTKLVNDGAKAMSSIEQFKPDLILLDLLLPNKDGFEILGELKDDPVLKKIPVIVLSNLGQDDDIKRALSLGAANYYVKAQHPVKEVVEKVHQYAIKGSVAR